MPLVSIIIPCRNEAGDIKNCLQSALNQDMPAKSVEIIVADGASDDGSREILSQMHKDLEISSRLHPAVTSLRVVDNPKRIVAAGLNVAIRAAHGGIIARMDAHTEYAPDYVRRCVEILEQTGADNVGGPARTKPQTYVQRAVAAAYHSFFSVGGARFHNLQYEGSVDTVTYGCWKRETFERFGYFDEELVRNQDDEHNLRIIRGGGKIWQSPQIKSWYHPRSSLRSLFLQYLQYGYWKVRVIRKHKLPASLRHLVPGAFVLTLMLLVSIAMLSLANAHLFSSELINLAPWQQWIAARCLAGLLAVYILSLLVASVIAAVRNPSALDAHDANWSMPARSCPGNHGLNSSRIEWKLLPMLPPVFACYHFGYGIGFLCGLWHAIVHRGSRSKFEQLSRPMSLPASCQQTSVQTRNHL